MWFLLLATGVLALQALVPAVLMGGISWVAGSQAWWEIGTAVFVWQFFDLVAGVDISVDDDPDDLDGFGTGM